MIPSSLRVLAVLALAPACASSTSTSPASAGKGAGGGSDCPDCGSISNPQSSLLQAVGGALEGFHVETGALSLRGKRLTAAALDDGRLVAGGRRRLLGEALAGATFEAVRRDGTRVPMRLSGMGPMRRGRVPGVALSAPTTYRVEVQRDGASWTPLCDGGAGATLVPGAFEIDDQGHVTGTYRAAPDRFTFACPDGAAAKCVAWGYAPWLRGGKMAAYYQACTRMARADYCGNGYSRTVEGTVINYGDFAAPQVSVFAHRDGFVPEAVWGIGDGGEPAALCLSRSRWSTVPIGPRSPCAELMPDPREDGPPSPRRRFCDDLTVADWAAEGGAFFVNSSRAMDVGLYVWTDDAGHYLSTTSYPWLGKGVDVEAPPGYPRFVSIEGSLYKPTDVAPNRPGLVPLYAFAQRDGGRIRALTTTDPAPAGWGDRTLAGYVYGPTEEAPVPTAQRLRLHGDGQGNFVTTSAAKPPDGYTEVAILGWLPH